MADFLPLVSADAANRDWKPYPMLVAGLDTVRGIMFGFVTTRMLIAVTVPVILSLLIGVKARQLRYNHGAFVPRALRQLATIERRTMTTDKVRIGIVGIGNMGRVHVKHVQDLPNTELVALCDRHPDKLKAIDVPAEVAVFTDAEQMMDSLAMEGLIIATPHYDHPDISIAAFERGIHVLVEKPIAVHIKEAQRMIDAYYAAKKTVPNLVFAAMFMQRSWGHWRKIKDLIDSGALGKLQRCSWIVTDWFRTQSYYDSGDWRATWSGEGGGVLMNQCPHNLDLYQWLLGMPARIHGFVRFGKHHYIEVEDEVTAYFEHADGMVSHFITSTGESPGSNRLEIVGENGRLVFDSSPHRNGGTKGGGELLFFRNAWSSIKQLRESPQGFAKVPCQREVVAFEHHGIPRHEVLIENFADAILHGTDLIAPAEEGLHSLTISNAIILSAHQRKTIDLPFDAEEYADLLRHYIDHPPRTPLKFPPLRWGVRGMEAGR